MIKDEEFVLVFFLFALQMNRGAVGGAKLRFAFGGV